METGTPNLVWICVRTEPQREAFAQANLIRTGLDVYCPMYERWISHARRRQLVTRPLFPNYLFTRSRAGLAAMGHVRRTPGVAALAARDLAAAIVPDAIIASLRARETDAGTIALTPDRFRPGEAVKIVDGPFQGFEAIFQETQDERRSLIFLSMFGRQHSLGVTTDVLESAA